MSDFLPTQPPGPGPTDAPLPTYQSYSAYVTSTYDYVTTITRVAYDPQGTLAPSLNIQTENGRTTSIGYSVVNLPLLYDGPLPPPPLGTLYTTANQRIAPAPTNQPSNGNGNGNGSGGSSGGNSGNGGQGSGQGSNNGGTGNGSNNGGSNGSGGSNSNGSNNGQGSGSNNGGTAGSNNGQGGGSDNGGTNDAGSSGGTNNGGTNGSGSNGGTNNGQGGNGAGTGSGGGNTNGQNGGTNNGGNQAGGQGSNNGQGSTGNGAGSNGNDGGANNGSNNGSGPNGNGGGGADNGNGGDTGAGGGGGISTGAGGSPTVTTNPPNATNDPAALSSSASAASVAASSAASSASAASVAATNAAESSAASLASVSAASAASSASLESVSASSLSATPSSTSSASQPTDSNTTNGGIPTANTPNSNFSKNGLSGGQIAGIVIGVLAAVLLALLLCLCCARRRRRKQNEEAAALTGGTMPFGRRMKRRVSDRWANGWSRGDTGPNGGPGTYSALGAGAGAAAVGAGAGAAAAGGRGSLRSDEWEEDHLDGGDGSGFFVVGGNRAGSQNPFSHEDDDEMREYGNAAPSSNKKAKAAGLAGLGAGLAAAFGAGKRRRSSGKGKEADHAPLPTSQDEADLADHDANQQDNDAERRGLMQNVDADMTADMTGDMSEMQQAGPSGWTRSPAPFQSNPTSPSSHSKAGFGTAAALGAGAAGAYYAGKHRGGNDDQSGDEMSSVAGAAPVSTISNAQRSSVITESGVASAYGSGTGSGTNPSSNSTGQRTSNSTFTGYSHGSPALHPPPSAPRGERQMYTFGNLSPRYSGNDQQGRPDRIPSFTGGFGDGDIGMFGHRSAADSYQGMDDNERSLAYAAAAAAAAAGGSAGLSALASHHRDSNQGTPHLGSKGQEGGNDERYSRFISRDTPLLGPGATHADVREKTDGSGAGASTLERSDSLGGHGRLPTIQSVGEFGERSIDAPGSTINQSSHSGTGTTRSGYGSGNRGQGSTFYSPAIPQTSQSMNSLGAVTAEEGPDDSQDPFSNDAAINTNESDQHHGQGYNDEETAAGALAGAGLFGSLASGWRKLTGTTPSHPSSSAGRGAEGSGGDTTAENPENSGDASMQRGISRDSTADVHHREPQAQRMLGDPDMAAEVQSQRASVQHANGSNLGHGNGIGSPVVRSGDGRSPSSSAKSGNGSGGSGAETRPQTLAEEPEEDIQGETTSPYVDDGNDADDEDAIGDRSKASVIAGAGAGALAAGVIAKGKQSSQAKSSSDDPYDHTSNTNESSVLAVRNPTEEQDSGPSLDTGLSRAATTGTYSSSMQTHSQSQPSEESGSRRTQQSSSGASTGAASYSPSYLARQPSGSTRGGGAGSSSMSSRGARGGGASSRRQGTNDESEYTSSSGQQRRETSTIDSGDGRSSMATAGGMDDGYRSNREPGPLARVQEDEDATGYDLGEGNEGVLPATAYYPSESLGAAVRRRAEQEARQEAQQHGSGESDQTGTSPQQQLSSISTTPRAIPLSLRPGGNPAESSQWRQSPRVDAVSQRAARNAASMERQHQRSQSGSGSTAAATSPRQEAGEGQAAQEQEGEAGEDETAEGNRRTTWPKFLRF